MKIYVASSWRNTYQPDVVAKLRGLGHQVYDFREHGFSWEDVSPHWENWTAEDYRNAINLHEIPEDAFQRDFEAMGWANATVLVLPCGRSAHLEVGWAIGQGKLAAVYVPDEEKSEALDLMHFLGDIVIGWDELQMWTEMHAFCPKCDRRFYNELEVGEHIMQAHLGQELLQSTVADKLRML